MKKKVVKKRIMKILLGYLLSTTVITNDWVLVTQRNWVRWISQVWVCLVVHQSRCFCNMFFIAVRWFLLQRFDLLLWKCGAKGKAWNLMFGENIKHFVMMKFTKCKHNKRKPLLWWWMKRDYGNIWNSQGTTWLKLSWKNREPHNQS